MKKLLFLVCICILSACKKDTSEGLTQQKWVLNSAIVSPAMTVNGRSETNYMTMSGASSCLNNDYTITFNANGTYEITSSGPLCDMIANLGKQNWTRKGDQITLTNPYTQTITATLKDDKLVYALNFTANGVNHTVVYQFNAKVK